MTKEEAIKRLKEAKGTIQPFLYVDEAIDYAIKTLEQQACEDCVSRQAVQDYTAKYLSQYLHDDVRETVEVIDEYIGELPPVNPQPKTDALDKIRAEIMDFEEELFHRPNTDYSDYAAVRHCVEIIDKYKAEADISDIDVGNIERE